MTGAISFVAKRLCFAVAAIDCSETASAWISFSWMASFSCCSYASWNAIIACPVLDDIMGRVPALFTPIPGWIPILICPTGICRLCGWCNRLNGGLLLRLPCNGCERLGFSFFLSAFLCHCHRMDNLCFHHRDIGILILLSFPSFLCLFPNMPGRRDPDFCWPYWPSRQSYLFKRV